MISKLSQILLILLTWQEASCSSLPSGTEVPMWIQDSLRSYAPIRDELSQALTQEGYQPRIISASAEIPRNASAVILVGTPNFLQGMVQVIDYQPAAEGFLVRKIRDKPYVIITGEDERGLIYGAFELAEQIRLKKDFPDLFPHEKRPYLRTRGFGMVWPPAAADASVFDSSEYPHDFCRHLIRHRFNLLVIQHHNSISELLYGSSPANHHQHQRFLNLVNAARRYQLRLAVWLNPDADLLGPQQETTSTEDRLDSWAEAVRNLAGSFPDLEFGLWPSDERRVRNKTDANQWFDGFLYPLREWMESPMIPSLSGQSMEPVIFEAEIARHLPVIPNVILKWGGDHPEAVREPSFLPDEWFQAGVGSFQILWALTDRDPFFFRSGSFNETRRKVMRLGAFSPDLSVGYVLFPLREELIHESVYPSSIRSRITWKWGFEKQWYRHAMYGRLSYDPKIEFPEFAELLTDRYGQQIAAAAIKQATLGGAPLQRITRYHWSYQGEDWFPEACLAPGEGGPYGLTGNRTGPMYRDQGEFQHPFESILEFVYNLPADPQDLSLVEAVGYRMAGLSHPRDRGLRFTPQELAEILRRWGSGLNEIIQVVDGLSQDNPELFEARHAAADIALQRLLSSYYRSKILAGEKFLLALCTDSNEYRQDAIKEMQRGNEIWKMFIERASRIYLFPPHLCPGIERWADLIGPADNDIRMIQEHPAFRCEKMKQEVHGPFIEGSSELITFEETVVMKGGNIPSASHVIEFSSFHSSNPLEQGWLDILNHYAGFLAFERLPTSGTGQGNVVWVPIRPPDSVGDFARIRLVSGNLDQITWGNRVVFQMQEDNRNALSEGIILTGRGERRTIWVRCRKPDPDPQGGSSPAWGFALAIDAISPLEINPLAFSSEGLLVQVTNQLPDHRLMRVDFNVEALGTGWKIPPQKPAPVSIGIERSFLLPCLLGEGWAALRLTGNWGNESAVLNFFPPLPHTNLTLISSNEGTLPRLVETRQGWGVGTDLQHWQHALLVRVNEAYLRRPKRQPLTRRIRVELFAGDQGTTLSAEYRSIHQGQPRHAFRQVPPGGWTFTLLPLPELLEEGGLEEGVIIRLTRQDHQDLVVRKISFE